MYAIEEYIALGSLCDIGLRNGVGVLSRKLLIRSFYFRCFHSLLSLPLCEEIHYNMR